MADIRAASRYVKSLLGLAVEKNVLDEVHQDMLLFAKVADESREFRLLLSNPIIKHDKKREILEQIFKGKVNPLTMAIFDIITKKHREPILYSIAKEFHNAFNEYKGIGKATVISAAPLDRSLRTELLELVKKISSRKEVELDEKVDASLIGGFILNVGDRQVDASMKSRLNALKVSLSHNPYIKEF
jgi:F-type H+-transporting ATPase subunit delta